MNVDLRGVSTINTLRELGMGIRMTLNMFLFMFLV